MVVADRPRRYFERVHERYAATQERCERARHLCRDEFTRCRTHERYREHQMIEPRALAGLTDPRRKSPAGQHRQHRDQQISFLREIRDRQDDARR
jgi:hypothetical protein